MTRREKTFLIRVSEKELATLRRRAAKAGMSVSEYIRFVAIESDDLQVVTIDTAPLRKLGFELTKQGTNLNQFMRFLNTYGVDVYNADETKRLLENEGMAFLRVMESLRDLKREAELHHVKILTESSTGKETEAE